MDEGRVSPMAGRQMREGTPTASWYPLRKTQARACRLERTAGPGVRPATSHTRATATDTGTRHDDPREGRTSGYGDSRPNSARIEMQAEKLPMLTMQLRVPTCCPLCTACYIHPNSMRTHLRRTHGDRRKVVARDEVSSNSAGRTFQQVTPLHT